MKLKFYYFTDYFSINLSKINIIYGYSGSGKTTLTNTLAEGLVGKNKSFSLDGLSIVKDEYNVIYINSKDSILDHLKLNSKSYIRKIYYQQIKEYLDKNHNIIESINDSFEGVNNLLNNIAEEFNSKSRVAKISLDMAIDDEDALIDNFINISFDIEKMSSSASKELLFLLISSLDSNNDKTIIIIDDFDSLLDEESTNWFLKHINDTNFTYILTSNKSTSLQFSLGRYSIFNIRYDKIYDFSNISYLIKKSLDDNKLESNMTYEEYMINFGYFENSGMLKQIETQIKISSVFNFGRMLTNRNYIITDEYNFDRVCITPYTDEEKEFLSLIDKYIND